MGSVGKIETRLFINGKVRIPAGQDYGIA